MVHIVGEKEQLRAKPAEIIEVQPAAYNDTECMVMGLRGPDGQLVKYAVPVENFSAVIHAVVQSNGGRIIPAKVTPVQLLLKACEVAEFKVSPVLAKALEPMERFFSVLENGRSSSAG